MIILKRILTDPNSPAKSLVFFFRGNIFPAFSFSFAPNYTCCLLTCHQLRKKQVSQKLPGIYLPALVTFPVLFTSVSLVSVLFLKFYSYSV